MRQTATIGVELGSRLGDPEVYESYEVRDPLGQRIGKAQKLFVNGSGEAEYLRVRLGFFGKSVLIPVEGIGADPTQRTLVLR